MEFQISDESINRHGFRIMTNGIRLENFKKNPVMLFLHDDRKVPIGKWINLRIDGDKLFATAEFDQGDEFAREIERKCANGYINATSVQIDFKAWNSELSMLLEGQMFPTCVDCDLLEISIVVLPANANAIRCSIGDIENLIPKLELFKPINNILNMKNIALALGLSADATEEQIVAAVESINTVQIDNVLSIGEQKGIVTAANKEQYRSLAKLNLSQVKGIIDAAPTVATTAAPAPTTATPGTLQAFINRQATATPDADNRSAWTLNDWSKKDEAGLLNMKRTEPDKYSALAKAHQASFVK